MALSLHVSKALSERVMLDSERKIEGRLVDFGCALEEGTATLAIGNIM